MSILTQVQELGKQLANSLSMYRDLFASGRATAQPPPGARQWEVYAFEAHPPIQPFVDKYTEGSTASRAHKPNNCLPNSGSLRSLEPFVKALGCSDAQDRACIFANLGKPLRTLRPEPRLSHANFLASRPNQSVRFATSHCGHSRPHFLHIPAAVGGQAALFWQPAEAHVRCQPRAHSVAKKLGSRLGSESFEVAKVDFVAWLTVSFLERDFVVLKLDVEGEEHALIPRMIREGTLRLIDQLLLECHPAPDGTGACDELVASIRTAAPQLMPRFAAPDVDSLALLGPSEIDELVRS